MNHDRFVPRGVLVLAALVLSLAPASGRAAGVKAMFDLSAPETAPFPTDLFTRPDAKQMTGLRVSLPKPAGCDLPTPPGGKPLSECADIDLVNQLDGFSLQPRLSIPFTDEIDVHSVSSSSVFVVRLASVPEGDDGDHRVIGINQIVWDVASKTLHVETEELLEQYTRYALIVTNGIRDASPLGDPVEASEQFADFRHDLNFGQNKDRALKEYRKNLLEALARAAEAGVSPPDVVAASVFTTLSVTPVMGRIRDSIKESRPTPADFNIASIGSTATRAVFPVSALTTESCSSPTATCMVFNRDRGPNNPTRFVRTFSPLSLLSIANPGGPNPVGQLAFGKYLSPFYLTSDASATFVSIPTRANLPQVAVKEIYFNLFLPSGQRPAAGWPIVIFGLGSGDNKNAPVPVSPPAPNPFEVASVLASHGLAVVAINSPGNGGGPLSTLELTLNAGCPGGASSCLAVLNAGGRSADQNGDGRIGPSEANGVYGPLILHRDVARQLVVDLMQLVRVIEVGMDVDGDRVIDPKRIYYLGLSLGARVGAMFAALDPSVRAAVLNSIAALPATELRLSPATRGNMATVPSLINYLGTRNPSLLNKGGTDFDDSMPLRDVAPVVVNPVASPGAMALQVLWDRVDWFNMPGAAIGYAAKLRKNPLEGMTPRPLMVSFARGDTVVPNPGASAFIRAGDLRNVTTLFRNDLAFAACKAPPCVRKDGHVYLVKTDEPGNLPYALQAQEQVARFFASDPLFDVKIDPDGDEPFFEVPIQAQPGWRLGVPEDTAFIQ